MRDRPYNPLDYENLTVNLVRELMRSDAAELPLPESFPGPGVYALFYTGGFAPYETIRSPECKTPIYVGKAVPPGARKGGGDVDDSSAALFRRIREHVSSLEAAENLSLEDFRCRYLTVVPLWITMAERFLIEHYRPIWNVCIEGFGLHDPGKGRHAGEIPWWDALHPGRSWATRLRQTKSEDEAAARLLTFLRDESDASRETP